MICQKYCKLIFAGKRGDKRSDRKDRAGQALPPVQAEHVPALDAAGAAALRPAPGLGPLRPRLARCLRPHPDLRSRGEPQQHWL